MKKRLLSFYLILLPATAFPVYYADKTENDSSSYRNFYLHEIEIVSNPKTELKAFGFPGSVSIFGENKIESMNVTSMKDLSTLAPNLFIPDYGSKLISSVYIRGIGSRINSPAVGLNVDNVPYLDKSAFDFDFLDIEKIEVLRGPQGTLYGRNTMAGLINIYTKSPFDYQGTKIKAGYGNYNAWQAAISHSHKINDKVAFSISGQFRKDDGYFKNVTTGKRSDISEVAGGRAQVQWRINRRLKINFTSDFEYSKQDGYPYKKYDEKTNNWGEVSYNDPSSYERNLSTNSIFLQFIHDRFIVSSTTGYQYLKDNLHMDQDFTPLSVFTLQQKQLQHAFTQEVAFKSLSEKPLQWVAGVFGFYQNLKTDGPVNFKEDGIKYLIEGQTNKQLALLKEDNPRMPDITLDVENTNLYIDGRYKTPTYGMAVFKQMTYNFPCKLSGTVGLRLDYEHTQIKHDTHSTAPLQSHMNIKMGPTTIPISLSPIPLEINGKEEMNTWELLPKFELKYMPDDKWFVYASVTRGYRSGGYNFQMFSNLIQDQIRTKIMEEGMSHIPGGGGSVPGHGNNSEISVNDVISYKPEHSWNYEIGGRTQLWEKRVSIDLSAFYIDCRNQQISVVSGYGRITKNSGHSSSKGLEASLRITPVNNLQFGINYGFTYAKFINNHDGETDYKDNYVPFAPKHTLAITGGYSIPVNCRWLDNININAQYIGRGRIYWNEANNVSQPYYDLIDGNISFVKGCIELGVWGKNLLNKRYQAFYFDVMNAKDLAHNNGFVQQGRPFTIGGNITVKF